jgi:replicative DNA helicase
MAGVAPLSASKEDTSRWQAAHEQLQRLEEILTAARRTLWEAGGANVLRYLQSRGYTDEIIRKTELGAWPKEIDESTVKDLGLNLPGVGTTHCLVIPMRNSAGTLAGFALRYVGKPPEGVPKFLYPKGLRRGELLCGLSYVRGIKKPAVIVEGWLDGEILRAYGIPALTVGSATLTRGQIDAVRKSSIKAVILCLDDDNAGQEGIYNAAEKFLREGLNDHTLRVYVAPSLSGLDPDEWVIKNGPDAFREHMGKSIPAATWATRYCFLGVDLKDSQSRDDAFDKAMDFTEKLPPIPRSETLAALVEVLGIPSDALKQELQRRDERQREQKMRKRIEKEVQDLRDLAAKGLPLTELRSENKRIVQEAERDLARITLKPVPIFAEAFDTTWDELRCWPEGLKLPWPMTTKVGITFEPGTFNVVAAQTSGGKTTFLLQATLHWLSITDKPIVMWSCETTNRVLMARLLAMIATERMQASPEYSMWDVISQIRQDRLAPELLAARDLLREYAPRLYHIDNGTLTAADFREMCSLLAQKHGGLGAIVADYLQAMDPSDELLRSREEEVARTTKELTWAAGLSADGGVEMAERFEVPVIAAAQFNRNINYTPDLVPALEHLRESGRIEQSAFVVIGLRNATMAKDTDLSDDQIREKLGVDAARLETVPAYPYASYGELEKCRLLARLALRRSGIGESGRDMNTADQPTLLELYVLKNRQRGKVGMVVPLVLHPRSGRITELPETFAIPEGSTAVGSSTSKSRPKRGPRK